MLAADEGAYGWLGRAAKPVALAFLFVAALALAAQFVRPYSVDFVSYWAAGSLVLDGNAAAAYDLDVHRAVEEQAVAVRGGMPFPYPPPFLILAAPFASLDFVPALIAWVVVTFAVYAFALRQVAPRAGWIGGAFPPVMTNAIVGQTGFLMFGLLAGGLALLPKRPLLAGAMLGLLVLKPQLGLVLPFVLLAGREWRAIAGVAAGSLGLLLVGAASFGADSYVAWLGQAPLYAEIARTGLTGWNEMASVYAALRLAGLGDSPALALHLLVALVAVVAACAVWRRTKATGARAASLAAATALASPYLYGYDTILLVLPFLWLAESAWARPVLAVAWGLSLASFLHIWAPGVPVSVAPLASILLLVLVCRHAWREEKGARPELSRVLRRRALV